MTIQKTLVKQCPLPTASVHPCRRPDTVNVLLPSVLKPQAANTIIPFFAMSAIVQRLREIGNFGVNHLFFHFSLVADSHGACPLACVLGLFNKLVV